MFRKIQILALASIWMTGPLYAMAHFNMMDITKLYKEDGATPAEISDFRARSQDFDVNTKNSDGDNLWHHIAKSGHVPFATAFAEKSGSLALLTQRNEQGLSPLHCAGSWMMAKWLLQQQVVQQDGSLWQPGTYTPLHHAAASNRCGVLQVLIKHLKSNIQPAPAGAPDLTPTVVDIPDGQGKTPLCCAVEYTPYTHGPRTAAAQVLVDHGANTQTAEPYAQKWEQQKSKTLRAAHARLLHVLNPYAASVTTAEQEEKLQQEVVKHFDHDSMDVWGAIRTGPEEIGLEPATQKRSLLESDPAPIPSTSTAHKKPWTFKGFFQGLLHIHHLPGAAWHTTTGIASAFWRTLWFKYRMWHR